MNRFSKTVPVYDYLKSELEFNSPEWSAYFRIVLVPLYLINIFRMKNRIRPSLVIRGVIWKPSLFIPKNRILFYTIFSEIRKLFQ